MGGMKISELDFVRLLPAFMRDDEAVIALSKALNKLMGEPGKRLDTIRTWDKIDELNEAECDELAWELDIDWYDSTGMSLEEKQATIKVAQQIKRKRGTKWAVERLISAYFGEGYVMEWYEMAGTFLNEPYTFVVLTTETHITAENFNKFMEAAKAAKNERSHIAGVFYFWQQTPTIEAAPESNVYRYDFDECGTRYRPGTVGFVVKHGIETEPEVKRYRYGFTEAGENTCGTYPHLITKGAALKAEAAVEQSSTDTVYGFPECGVDGTKAKLGAAIVGTAIVGRAVIRS